MKWNWIILLNMYACLIGEEQHLMFCSNWNDQLWEPINHRRVLLPVTLVYFTVVEDGVDPEIEDQYFYFKKRVISVS